MANRRDEIIYCEHLVPEYERCNQCEQAKLFVHHYCGCDCHECWAGIHCYRESRDGVCKG